MTHYDFTMKTPRITHGFYVLFIFLKFGLTEAARATITNVRCKSFNRSFVDFTECRLRLVGRNINEVSITLKINEVPLDNLTARFQLMKKSNGYRPYIIDLKADICKFMSSKRNRALNFVYKYLQPYMNVNHSCPFKDAMILKNLRLSQELVNAVTLLPSADYAIFITWMVNNVKITNVHFFIKYDEN